MAQQGRSGDGDRRGRRDGSGRDGRGSGDSRGAAGRPTSGGRGSGTGAGSSGRGGARSGGPSGARGRTGGDKGRGSFGGSGRGSGRGDSRGGPGRGDPGRSDAQRSAEQAVYDGPPLDDSITGRELDRGVLQQLKGLPEKLAARVARHLVAAGRLLDNDPQTAYQHTLAARARAARIAVVREACGEAAYAAGEYADALSELRAAKRMNGSSEYLPVMADCERALGRPEKALELARSAAVTKLPDDLKAEMTIVEAGARRDRGELEAALRTLEAAPLRSRSRADWLARLRYAYADTLLASGRRDEAIEWFHRTEAVDGDQVTDAAQRVAALEEGAED